MSKKELIVGIDLGTTNSAIAYVEGGKPIIIPNAEGGRTTPSVVSFNEDGSRVVGALAKRQMVANPERTVIEIKRKMGTNHKVKILGKEYTPQEISAMILQKLKADAEAYLGQKVEKAVITCPAYFSDAQRQATKDAGRIAGLDVVRIINEPTAAALAYGLDKQTSQTVLVYDLGGGTFDVSILEIGDGVIEVKATSGNNHLGGADFDQRIMDWLITDFKNKEGIDLRQDRTALQRIKEAAEQAKIELSSLPKTRISLQYIAFDQNGPKHLEAELTREQFEEMTRDLVDKTIGPVKQALQDADLEPNEIDKILLVGGSTRIPAVQRRIKEIFNKEPFKGINPDEVVALGAALQGAVISGEVKDILLLDVTPLSLGVETQGGVFTKIIERNTTIPIKKSKVFTTAADRQTQVEIHVLQGERAMARDNISLGRFYLTGIPPAPRGVPQIEVTFDIDSNGIVHVSAKDLGTGKEQEMVIQKAVSLSEDEIERMINDAKRYEEEDKKAREEAEIYSNANSMVFSARKTLEDLGDKVTDDEKQTIEGLIKEIDDAIQAQNKDKAKQKTEELNNVLMKIGQRVYQNVQGAGAGPQGAPGGFDPSQFMGQAGAGAGNPGASEKKKKDDDDFVNADYKVVD